MISKEFLKEDDWDDSEAEYNAMERKIHDITIKYGLTNEQVNFAWEAMEDCKPYLTHNSRPLTDGALYRGMHSSKSFLTKQVRLDDRRPLDSGREFHKLLNKRMIELFGQPFRNALFATGNKHETDNYGDMYIVLPRGSFKFLWSPTIIDIFNFMESGLNMPFDDMINELFSENEYKTSDLRKAIGSKNEIMIRCQSYYAIKFHKTNTEQREGMELILHL